MRDINVLLVVDKSAGMAELHATNIGVSKWDTMRSALGAMFTKGEGTSVDGHAYINLGLELFPQGPAATDTWTDSCFIRDGGGAITVPIQTGKARLNDVFDAINAESPSGYAPTAEALRRAYDYYTKGDGYCLPGSKWVLLVTNGGANCNSSLNCGACTPIPCPGGAGNCCLGANYLCNDDDSVVSAIGDLASAGIKTFVAGMPESDADAASLNAFANAGMMPNPNGPNGNGYYPIPDTLDASDLECAFFCITTRLIASCDIPLRWSPATSDNAHVFINCMPVPASPSDSSSGWYFDFNQSPAHVIFHGDVCTEMYSSVVHAVDIFTGCTTP